MTAPAKARTFSSAEVAELAGVTLRQCQHWDEKKVVSPRHVGHRRIYSQNDVLDICVIADLRQKNISLQRIRKILQLIRKRRPEHSYLLVWAKGAALEETKGCVMDRLAKSKEPVVMVAISELEERVGRV